eukprot:115969_1
MLLLTITICGLLFINVDGGACRTCLQDCSKRIKDISECEIPCNDPNAETCVLLGYSSYPEAETCFAGGTICYYDLVNNNGPGCGGTDVGQSPRTNGCQDGQFQKKEPVKTRDCSVLAIDDFLLECSTEFETQTTDIQGLKDQIAAMNNKLDNAGNDIEIEGKTLSTVVADLQSDIDACEGRFDSFAAQSIQNKMNIDSENNTQMLSFIGMKLSDILIIVLLSVNLMVMRYIHCYRGSKGGQIAAKQYDFD